MPLSTQSDLEGVTKFQNQYAERSLSPVRFSSLIARLSAWRAFMVAHGMLGQDPMRYGGVGFGNLSARIGPYSGPKCTRPFVISGTQTNALPEVGLAHFSVVSSHDIGENRIKSFGPVEPSSESLTHGAIYDLSSSIRFVMHGHSPLLFRHRKALRIPTTGVAIPYGTVAMAREMRRLYSESTIAEKRILAMEAHEDGIITFGKTAWEAGQAMLRHVILALEHGCHPPYSHSSPR
jgi:L-ribulose-5-phosphate 4-epimerase